MHKSATTRRGRAIIASVLLAGALAIGAVASSSTQADTSDTEAGSVKIGVDIGPMSMRSGIRW